MTDVAVKEAKNSFTQLVRQVESGEPVRILRHGNAVAVLSSVAFFDSEMRNSDFESSLNQWREKTFGDNSDDLTNQEIDEIFDIKRKIEKPRDDALMWKNAK